jgi:hypothetical protein
MAARDDGLSCSGPRDALPDRHRTSDSCPMTPFRGDPRSRPPALSDTSFCLLGPEIEHRDSLAEMLKDRAAGTHWVPDSHTFARQREIARGRFDRSLDSIFGTRDRVWLDHLLAEIDRHDSKIAIVYWGTIPLGDAIALKNARPGLRIVAMMLCFPLSLERWGILRQTSMLRRAASSLDGLLCPTAEMAGYIEDRVLGTRCPPIAIVAPCWPARYVPETRPQRLRERPNLVYIGRTDLSGATVHKADDIRPLMREILDAGIELHHGQSPETEDGHAFRKPFAPLPNDELIATMASFDASLIAYNLAACARTDRFELTVPDRLLSSVAAGVPIAIPRKGYAASRTYLRDYDAVFEFDAMGDLKAALSDRAAVRTMQDRAWDARRRFTAAAHGTELSEFLERVRAS